MQGTAYFKIVNGDDAFRVGTLQTTNLALSDGDANAGVISTGKAMTFAANSLTQMRLAGQYGFVGFLSQDVNHDGLANPNGTYLPYTRGWLNQPVRRGLAVTLLVPQVFSLIEFEGLGTVGINTLVVTSGTGSIASNTAIYTELTLESGAWRKAAAGEIVYARLMDASLTPVIGGNRRICVQMCSPYVAA